MILSQSPPMMASQAAAVGNQISNTANAGAAQSVGQGQVERTSFQSQPVQEAARTGAEGSSGNSAGSQVSFRDEASEKFQASLAATQLAVENRFDEANAAADFLSKMGSSSVADAYEAF